MTEKQEKIITAALTLFAENGYDATSTSKVAKAAGVSEGLIFRHFQNKEGLLQAIMDMGGEKAEALYQRALSNEDPKQLLKAVLSLPFNVSEEEHLFWKLLYAVKWQANVYDDTMSTPLKKGLEEAFRKLKYPHPDAEAEVVMILIDGIATAVLLRKPKHTKKLLTAILAKYDIA